MKSLVCLLSFLATFSGYAQAVKAEPGANGKKVSFTATIDINNATKDGIYLNGYVVNIPYSELEKLNGKKVKITGRITVIKGMKNDPPGAPVRQGRDEDALHIVKPRIRILN